MSWRIPVEQGLAVGLGGCTEGGHEGLREGATARGGVNDVPHWDVVVRHVCALQVRSALRVVAVLVELFAALALGAQPLAGQRVRTAQAP